MGESDTSRTPAGRPAAFFDLDRTLIEGSSGLHFGRAAYRAGVVSRRQMITWGVDHLRFRLRGSTDETTHEVMGQIKAMLAGVEAISVERLAPEVLAGVLPRLFPQMLEEIRAHQDAGRPTYIVSATGSGIVEMLATILGMDGGIGTRFAVDEDGVYTGEIDGPFTYGEGKVEAMSETAATDGLALDASYAYSDSASDLPMLRAVRHAIAVNPDQELTRIAREEGWRVMRFDRLGRRIVALGATLGALMAGGIGSAIVRRGRSGSRIARMRRR